MRPKPLMPSFTGASGFEDMYGVAARALYVGALMPATAYPTGSCTCTSGHSRVAEEPSASSCPRIHRMPPCCSQALPFPHPADVRVVHEVRGAMVPDKQASRPAEDRHHLRAALRRLLDLRGEIGGEVHLASNPSWSLAYGLL